MRLDDLSPEEYEEVNAEFFAAVKGRDTANVNDLYMTYIAVLNSWGIMCPHPLAYRFYDGVQPSIFPQPFDEHRWFECKLCATRVINR